MAMQILLFHCEYSFDSLSSAHFCVRLILWITKSPAPFFFFSFASVMYCVPQRIMKLSQHPPQNRKIFNCKSSFVAWVYVLF